MLLILLASGLNCARRRRRSRANIILSARPLVRRRRRSSSRSWSQSPSVIVQWSWQHWLLCGRNWIVVSRLGKLWLQLPFRARLAASCPKRDVALDSRAGLLLISARLPVQQSSLSQSACPVRFASPEERAKLHFCHNDQLINDRRALPRVPVTKLLPAL